MKPFVISLIILIVIMIALIFSANALTDHVAELQEILDEFTESKESFSDINNSERSVKLEADWIGRKKFFSHFISRKEIEQVDVLILNLKCALEEKNFSFFLVAKRNLKWKLEELLEKQKINFSVIL